MHLVPEFGDLCMKDVSAQHIQGMIARKQKILSAKSIRNLVATLRMMWTQARAWGYTQHDPFFGLVLPERGLLNERFLSLDEMKRLIDAAPEPSKPTTGFSPRRVCAPARSEVFPRRILFLDQGVIKIAQSVWHGKIQTVKSVKGNRLCEVSPQLVAHLRDYLRRSRPNKLGSPSATSNGTPWDTDLVRKRKLYPLLEKLKIERCGFHAFRHGNETVMDQESVPMAVRQSRLGHTDARTTMLYTHIGKRRRPQDRGSIRRAADIVAHRGDHASRKRLILEPNGAKLGELNRLEVVEGIGCRGWI